MKFLSLLSLIGLLSIGACSSVEEKQLEQQREEAEELIGESEYVEIRKDGDKDQIILRDTN